MFLICENLCPINQDFAPWRLGEKLNKEDRTMTIFYLRRSSIDRRECEDMRESHNLDYFEEGGLERRVHLERRKLDERRSDWIRVSKWRSVCVGKI